MAFSVSFLGEIYENHTTESKNNLFYFVAGLGKMWYAYCGIGQK